jgi:hypothetical protein
VRGREREREREEERKVKGIGLERGCQIFLFMGLI